MGDDYIAAGEGEGPSRRELIRRGAIVLGLGAWAAPLVQVVRQSGQGESAERGIQEKVIGVQQVAECATCAPECGSVVECGAGGGVFTCFCAPSASAYPMASCICAEDVFCDEATLCTAGCPDGWACAQGCCPEPVCLPPCPEAAVFAAQAAGSTQESEGTRLTVSGMSR